MAIHSNPSPTPEPSLVSLACLKEQIALTIPSPRKSYSRSRQSIHIDSPSFARRQESLSEIPLDLEVFVQNVKTVAKCHTVKAETVFYLAYGSNLSAETFQGKRGIKPLSQINVLVPSLRLTFDLAGIPYTEPCFANTGLRNVPFTAIAKSQSEELVSEKTPLILLTSPPPYHKDRWSKGLVGVVYELTLADYAHVIATEGGGASYHDLVIECYPLESEAHSVPEHPVTIPFKAHTLFAPARPVSNSLTTGTTRDVRKRSSRPNSSYAQPSARYLKLITDGADEHDLPEEYKTYLHQIRPYQMTSARQRIGQFIFLSIWGPIIMSVFAMQKLVVDDQGKVPPWMVQLLLAVFAGVWSSYDGTFKNLFGDGERTEGQTSSTAYCHGTSDLALSEKHSV